MTIDTSTVHKLKQYSAHPSLPPNEPLFFLLIKVQGSSSNLMISFGYTFNVEVLVIACQLIRCSLLTALQAL